MEKKKGGEKEKEQTILNILPAPSCDTSSAPEEVNPCPHAKLETFFGVRTLLCFEVCVVCRQQEPA